MEPSDQNRTEAEIERLRTALDASTRQCLDLRRQLDGASAEFEEFISIAAHNLRESLRDVTSFGQLIAESDAGRLNAESGQFLGRIQNGAANMQSLLADIVDYWAAGTGDLQFSNTDMEAVLCQALLSTDSLKQTRCAVVIHDPLPVVTGDFETLAKVLKHLIRNAIEYCVAPSPRVHISSERLGSEWVFSVQDTGPGIDPAFQARIFGAFKRLHGREHPGSGLGLSFCRRAIERHGGRIWVESTPGAGSIFHFTLPPVD